MSFLAIPGIGIFVLLAVKPFLSGVRARPRDRTAMRQIDEETIARLDRIAADAKRPPPPPGA